MVCLCVCVLIVNDIKDIESGKLLFFALNMSLRTKATSLCVCVFRFFPGRTVEQDMHSQSVYPFL